MKKKIILFIILIGLVILGFMVFKTIKSQNNRITGDEWFNKQQTYVDELETYSDEVSDVYLLYFNGNIGADDFYNHVTVLQQELTIMKEARNKELEAHPIKPDTYGYYAKLGCEAVDNAYETYEGLLSASLTNYEDSSQVMYDYLTVKSDMKNIMWDYALAVSYYQNDSESSDSSAISTDAQSESTSETSSN